MNITRSYALALRYWYLLSSQIQRIFQVFVWGTFDVLLWGFLTRYLSSVGMDAFNFTTVLLGALILWQLVTRVQQSFVVVFLEDIYTRNFLNLFSSPLRISEYVVGIIMISSVMTAAAFVFIAMMAVWIFGLSMSIAQTTIVLPVIILACFGLAVGILAAAVVMRFGPSAEWFVWPIPAVIGPFAGVFYPISVLPSWAQGAAHFLPPTYAFEAFRASMNGTTMPQGSFVALVLSLVYLIGAGCLFSAAYRWALRTGAIVRYGAEAS